MPWLAALAGTAATAAGTAATAAGTGLASAAEGAGALAAPAEAGAGVLQGVGSGLTKLGTVLTPAAGEAASPMAGPPVSAATGGGSFGGGGGVPGPGGAGGSQPIDLSKAFGNAAAGSSPPPITPIAALGFVPPSRVGAPGSVAPMVGNTAPSTADIDQSGQNFVANLLRQAALRRAA